MNTKVVKINPQINSPRDPLNVRLEWWRSEWMWRERCGALSACLWTFWDTKVKNWRVSLWLEDSFWGIFFEIVLTLIHLLGVQLPFSFSLRGNKWASWFKRYSIYQSTTTRVKLKRRWTKMVIKYQYQRKSETFIFRLSTFRPMHRAQRATLWSVKNRRLKRRRRRKKSKSESSGVAAVWYLMTNAFIFRFYFFISLPLALRVHFSFLILFKLMFLLTPVYSFRY